MSNSFYLHLVELLTFPFSCLPKGGKVANKPKQHPSSRPSQRPKPTGKAKNCTGNLTIIQRLTANFPDPKALSLSNDISIMFILGA